MRWRCGSGPTISTSGTRDGRSRVPDVSLSSGVAELEVVANPRLFATRRETPQPGLFGPDDAPGEGGWRADLRSEGNAARTRRPEASQPVLFACPEAP